MITTRDSQRVSSLTLTFVDVDDGSWLLPVR